MIEIIPAIDIIAGRCVRLTKGDFASEKSYDVTPVEMALKYAEAGVRRLHLVDLDGAKEGKPMNMKTLSEIHKAVPGMDIEWGGGISKEDHVDMALEAGAGHVIVGSTAVREPLKMVKWLREFGGEKIVLGADVRDGAVAVKGWTETSEVAVEALVERFVPKGLKEVIVTDISRDGMLQGPADGLYVALKERFPEVVLTVSGGIASMEDIERLNGLGLDRVIVGKAVYEGRISLKEIELWSQKG